MEVMKRRQLSADAWRAVLGRFAESGLTVQAFCEREAVAVASFYQWRAKVGGAVGEPKSHATAGESLKRAGFVDLGALSASVSRMELRLDLGGGVLLHRVRG